MNKNFLLFSAAALFGSVIVYLVSNNAYKKGPLLPFGEEPHFKLFNKSPEEAALEKRMNNLINDEQFNYKIKSVKDLQ